MDVEGVLTFRIEGGEIVIEHFKTGGKESYLLLYPLTNVRAKKLDYNIEL